MSVVNRTSEAASGRSAFCNQTRALETLRHLAPRPHRQRFHRFPLHFEEVTLCFVNHVADGVAIGHTYRTFDGNQLLQQESVIRHGWGPFDCWYEASSVPFDAGIGCDLYHLI
jgi:hypothetical protein